MSTRNGVHAGKGRNKVAVNQTDAAVLGHIFLSVENYSNKSEPGFQKRVFVKFI